MKCINSQFLANRHFKQTPLNKSGAGFTLIETIVYLSLFAIFMSGVIAAAYNMIEASGRNQAKAMVEQEGDFLIAKIDWALSGLPYNGINLPSTTTPSSILSVTKYDGTSVIISLNGDNDIQLQKGSDTYTLNNSNIKVKGLIFIHTSSSGDGINPESVTASTTLESITTNGMVISQNFSTTKFLRR